MLVWEFVEATNTDYALLQIGGGEYFEKAYVVIPSHKTTYLNYPPRGVLRNKYTVQLIYNKN